MNRITAATARIIATAALRLGWTILDVAINVQARGERLEAWAGRLAARWGCEDDVIATVTSEALSS